MGRGRIPAVSIELPGRELEELEGLARRRRTAQGLARRARIVLLAAEGLENKATRDRFARHPRWHVHFTPTSASWLNQVERFFALLTDKQPRRGVHRSTRDLEAAILGSIETVNADPKPFRWTKSAADILATIQRFCLSNLKLAGDQNLINETSGLGP